jgi:sialic acid synthase SpsE
MKRVLIIAEVGNLHEGSIGLAKSFIEEVAASGADVVKFQIHIFEAESLPDAPAPSYFKKESRKQYLERTSFKPQQWLELKEYAEKVCGVEFMASVFSLEAIELAEELKVRRYKIPSGEVTNLPLLEKVAKLNKPVLLSTGMSNWAEIDNAINTLRNCGCEDITILQCTSIYPCPPQKVGLNLLREFKRRYNLPVGLSDHTLGFAAAIAAVVMGAMVIEKHFTLSRKMYGSDAKHSLEPDEFRRFVQEIRETEEMFRSVVDKDKLVQELKELKIVFEKSIVARRSIKRGEIITLEKLSFKKPGDGIRADRYKEVLGKKAKVDIPANVKITEEMLQ